MPLSHKNIIRFVIVTFTLVAAVNFTYAQQQGPPPGYFNERFVIKYMAQLTGAQATYSSTTGAGSYGSLAQLHTAGLIDAALASGLKHGYSFEVVPAKNSYTARAAPIVYKKTGLRSYYTDQRGVLFGADLGGLPANDSNALYIDSCALWGLNDNERCVISAMRTLHSAQMTYAATVGGNEYAAFFGTLHSAGLIDMVLASASKHGYDFKMLVLGGPPSSFRIWAVPHTYGSTGVRSFFVDVTGVIRGADRQGNPADPSDPPVN